jgi:hypothetical protein
VTARPRPFRYHAVDVDLDRTIDTFDTQAEATTAILHAGEAIALAAGEKHAYAVRIESIASGNTYDIPLEVEGL